MPKYEAFPSKDYGLGAYSGSINVHIENGRCMPAFDFGEMSGSADISHYFIREAIETINPAGNPRQYAFGNNKAFYYEDATRTDDLATNQLSPSIPQFGVATTTNAVVQGAQIVNDNDGSKTLLVGFGTGNPDPANATFTGNAQRSLTTDTNPWTLNVDGSTTYATFFKIITVGADIIAATGGGWTSGANVGRTQLGDYYICKCPNGSDPTLAASYGNRTAVGTAEWPIIELVPLGDSYCVAKGDGLWFLNDKTKRHENALAAFELTPHALNGKGMSPGENGVWYPTADGRLFFFNGVTAYDMTPYKGKNLPRDAAMSRYSVVVDRGAAIIAIRESWHTVVEAPRAAADLGMKVIKVTGAGQTATDITTLVTDGKLSTPIAGAANMGSWGANSTDKFYVGLNVPFEGVDINVTRLPNAANNSFTSPQYSDGAAGWPTLGTVVDHTKLGLSNRSLVTTGFPASSSRGVLSGDGIRAIDLMTLESVAFGGAVGTVGPLYWARWSPTNTTAMTSTTTIDEVSPIVCRAAYPNTTGSNSPVATATQDFLPRILANAGVSIIDVGYRVGGQIEWAPEYAVYTLGGVWAAAWTMARGGTMTNGGAALLLWGRDKQFIVAEGVIRDPFRVGYPKLVQPGTSKPCPTLALSRLLFGDPTRKKRLNAIHIQGEGIKQTDTLTVYAWWDSKGPYFELDTRYGAPATFRPPPGFGNGRELNLRILISDVSQADPLGPAIERVIVDIDDEGAPYDFGIDSNPAIPEVV